MHACIRCGSKKSGFRSSASVWLTGDSCDTIEQSDKFEKLFRVYAELAKVPLVNLSFRFDGDQLSPNSTPKEHDMEDGELIEVYNKSWSDAQIKFVLYLGVEV